MLLEAREQSRTVLRAPKTAFPPDPEFANTCYIDRYQIAFKRLRKEGDMNAVCLVTSDREQDDVGYPDQDHDLHVVRHRCSRAGGRGPRPARAVATSSAKPAAVTPGGLLAA